MGACAKMLPIGQPATAQLDDRAAERHCLLELQPRLAKLIGAGCHDPIPHVIVSMPTAIQKISQSGLKVTLMLLLPA